jgi:hypothetical protein
MRALQLVSRWRRGAARSTLSAPVCSRIEVCPPSLRHAPNSRWDRFVFWLLAPAPADAAPAPSRLPAVRAAFRSCLADLDPVDVDELHRRIDHAHSLRELWHLRPEVYRVVGLHHSQWEAERRLARLNPHFPTRAPRAAIPA